MAARMVWKTSPSPASSAIYSKAPTSPGLILTAVRLRDFFIRGGTGGPYNFGMDGSRIAGLTAEGRTTAWLLDFNCDERLALRDVLLLSGEWDAND
jgi:hypothetical protein